MMSLDGYYRLCSLLLRGALLTLTPTPAPRNYQFCFVRKNYFARFGVLHLVLLGTSTALAVRSPFFRGALAAQVAVLAVAAARPGLARYYVLVSWATVEALAGYLRRGVPAVWEKAEGTR